MRGGRAFVAVVGGDAKVGSDRRFVRRVGETGSFGAEIRGRVDEHLDELGDLIAKVVAVGSAGRIHRHDRDHTVLSEEPGEPRQRFEPAVGRALGQVGVEGGGVEHGARLPIGPEQFCGESTHRPLPGAATAGQPDTRGRGREFRHRADRTDFRSVRRCGRSTMG